MSENTEFQRIWTEALVEYERDTGRDLKIDPNVQNLANIEDLLSEIQGSEQRFKDFRARQQKLWSALRRCMSPVELAASLVKDALGSTPYAPINVLFSAILYLVKVRSALRSALGDVRALIPVGGEWRDGVLQQYRESFASTTRFHGSIAGICQAQTRCKPAEKADCHPEHVCLHFRSPKGNG